MADIYIDYQNGNDTTGDGSSGTPWKTLQKAVDNADPVTNGGPQAIFVANTAAQVLAASIDWTSGFGSVSVTAPLIIRAWDNGGALVITHPSGSDLDCGEIDGNDAVATLFATASSPLYVYLYRMKCHSTTGIVVDPSGRWVLIECEVYDGSGSVLIDTSSTVRLIRTVLRDDGGASVDGHGACETSIGCYYKGLSGKVASLGDTAMFCHAVINDVSETPAVLFDDYNNIFSNTFYGGTGSSLHAIDIGSANVANLLFDNLASNFDGTGNVGIDYGSGAGTVFAANNGFWNNTTDTQNLSAVAIDSGNHQTESSDPFANAAGGDFELVSTANCYGTGYLDGWLTSATAQNDDIGAVQHADPAGGGGLLVHPGTSGGARG